MFNFYEVKTDNAGRDEAFAGQTAAGGQQVTLSPLFLPAYICPRGTTVACTAANGTLNPNNPFAAQGNQARLLARYDRHEQTLTDAKTFRFSTGINGSFGDGWNYNVDGTYSRVNFKLTQKNFINARHLLDVIADGSYNFVVPGANSEAVRDYLSPINISHDHSSLGQVQATLSKSFFELPGGQLQVLVGGSYRRETIYEPSANPPNATDPYDRYYRVNAVEVIGKRNVKSAFFEVDAPIVQMVDLKAQGRYDKYSTGQHNFSPKFEATFQPIHQVKFRGTYSKGFRVPSLAEAFGAPATGYITTQLTKTDPAQAAFIAAHGNDAYATQQYSYGLTGSGNPSLAPEKSTQWTAGVVLTPIPQLTLTADYYHVRIKGVINPPDCSAAIAQYYQNNGTTNVPGCKTTAGVPDPLFPNATPLLGDVSYSYVNADAFKTSGIDLSATLRLPIAEGIRWTSSGNATYIKNLSLIQNGNTFRFDGTLSPCNITSCSGTPKWRASWENTLDVGKASVTLTGYYTSGYSLISVDPPYSGVRGDCLGSLGNSIVTYADGATPVACSAKKFIDFDLTANYKVNKKFTLYMNLLNVFGAHPPFDPSAGYSLYQFNPAWADQGFIGRYVRIGAKVDF
jgi:iron complex outermembrane receptor protein